MKIKNIIGSLLAQSIVNNTNRTVTGSLVP